MRHRNTNTHGGRRGGARALMLRNLTSSILLHERVRTTAGRARAVRPLVERCITISRTPSLRARRQLLATLAQPRAVAKTLEVIGPRYQERASGYTRITAIGRRVGDGAPEVLLELV